jgi:hypothetical protein
VIGPYLCHICYYLHRASSSSDSEDWGLIPQEFIV